MLKFRVRFVNDNGEAIPGLPSVRPMDIEYAQFEGEAPYLRFKLSRRVYTPAQYPFLVRVEYSVDGNKYEPLPENELFIVEKDSDDSKDSAKVVTYTAELYVLWLLAGAYVGTGQWEKNGERAIDNAAASAGRIMSFFIDESKGRGWAAPLLRGFDAANDSAGAAWVVADREKISWRLETFYSTVLNQLSEQGMCNWRAVGRTLNLYRYGTRGRDKTELVLGGQNVTRVPVSTDASEQFTHVIALYDGGRVHVQNTAAEARFGRRSKVLTLTGVKDSTTAQKLANQLLAEGQLVRREESYEWTPGAGDVHPFADLLLGDQVTARARGGRQIRRVIGIIVRQQTGPATVQIRAGERVSTIAAQNARRLGSVTSGGVIGGSGGAFPTSPGLPNAKPDRPDGLTETSNSAVWLADGRALSTVGLGWAAVTHAQDGSEIDTAFYELHSRLPHEAAALDTTVTGTSVSVALWTPGVTRLVSVVAVSAQGERSLPSLELEVTPAVPASVVPKAPTGLTVASNVGAFTPAGPVAAVKLDWAAVTQSTDNEPLTVAEYIVLMDGFELTRTSGLTVTVTVPSDAVRGIRVIAVTGQGVQGDPSALVSVTGAKPALVSRVPSAPTFKTGFGSLITVWDGVYTTGGTAGAHSVRVEARVGTSGAFTVQGTLTSAGEQLISLGDVDDTVQVRFIAVDALGRDTGTSATASGTRVGIQRVDLDTAVDEFLTDLDELAGNAWNAASVAVINTVVEYAVGSSETVAPSTGWSTATPTRTPGSFIWMRTIVTKGDDTTSTTSPALVTGNAGAKGDPGAQGVSVTSVTPFFQINSGSTPAKPTVLTPPAPWQVTEPAFQSGMTLWSVTRVVYSSGSFSYTEVSKVSAYTAAVLADGKLTLASANPTTGNGAGKPVGALWMTKTGSAFSSMWEWSGTAWAQRPLSETIIPLIAIGAGTYGELSGSRLTARSISALKLALGDFTNLVNDGIFANGNTEWAGQAIITSTTEPNCLELTTAASGNNDKNNSAFFESWQGAEYYAEFEVWADPANTAFRNANLWVSSVNDAGANVAWPSVSVLAATLQANPGTWVKAAGVITHTHAATRQARIAVSVSQGTPGVAGQKYRFRNLQVRRRNTAELLVDGSVSARTLDVDEAFADEIFGNEATLGKVNVDHLAPNVGENLNITSNSAVVFIVGKQAEQDAAIADAQNTADAANTLATTANTRAGSAEAAASIASGQALVAKTLAEGAQADVDELSAVIVIDALGIVIGKVDASTELRLRSDYAAFAVNGVESSRWEAGRLIVNEGIFTSARIAEHQIKRHSAGNTVITPIQ